MRILIAHDGSRCSDAANEDLRRAGLPASAEVLVFSVAETVPQVAQTLCATVAVGYGLPLSWPQPTDAGFGICLEPAQLITEKAAKQLHLWFPDWNISTDIQLESAKSAIVEKAKTWKPDLLVMGSHGKAGWSQFVLGRVSQHVLHEVNCPVRIARHTAMRGTEQPIRLIIGVDGSLDSLAAVRHVAGRKWPEKTEAFVVGAVNADASHAPNLQRRADFSDYLKDRNHRQFAVSLQDAAGQLQHAGLKTTSVMRQGNPGLTLVAEAEDRRADCIFVGARGLNRLQRFLIGSVSCTVASRAECSVEVIRRNEATPN